MSKRDEYCDKYLRSLEKHTQISGDRDAMMGIIKACGPSIYRNDSETVSSGDEEEMNRVKNGFMKKHLNVEGDEADKALDAAIDRYGRSNTSKYRAVLYYLMADEAGKIGNFK